MNIRVTHTRRRSSFLLAISLAFSSLDISTVDFETGCGSIEKGGGEDIGVDRELEAGEIVVGLPLDFRCWVWI